MTTYKRTCNQCKNYYEGRGAKFCSKSCNITWNNLHNNVTKRDDVKAKLSKIAKEGNYQARMMTPESRKKAVKGMSKALSGRTLSKEHREAIGRGSKRAGCTPPRNDHLVGPRHPNWKGGHSKIRSKEFGKKEYTDFRNAVLERDGFICQDCNKKGQRLEVHHIKEWGPYPELRYNIDNGITLCRKCHLTRHRGAPRPITIGPRVVSDLY